MLRRDGTLALAPRLFLAVAVVVGLVAAATSDPLTTLFFLSYVLVGGLLAIRRPTNVVSWLLILIAFSYVGTMNRSGLDVAGLKAGTASPRR